MKQFLFSCLSLLAVGALAISSVAIADEQYKGGHHESPKNPAPVAPVHRDPPAPVAPPRRVEPVAPIHRDPNPVAPPRRVEPVAPIHRDPNPVAPPRRVEPVAPVTPPPRRVEPVAPVTPPPSIPPRRVEPVVPPVAPVTPPHHRTEPVTPVTPPRRVEPVTPVTPPNHTGRNPQSTTPPRVINSNQTPIANHKGLNGFFKGGDVEVREHKNGGASYRQGDKTISTRPDGSVALIKNGDKTSYTNRAGAVTTVQEQIRDNSGRSIGSRQMKYDKDQKVAIEKTFVNRDGVRIRQQTNLRTGVRYNENITRINNRNVVQRTYIRNNVTIVRNYNVVVYGGYNYRHYSPSSYWSGYWAGYYNGVTIGSLYYNPWARPYYYAWTWENPYWSPYYGYYWRPYPVYRSLPEWLVDYSISSYLTARYQSMDAEERLEAATQRANAAAAEAEEITAEMKAQLAEQARQEMQSYQNQTSTPIQTVLSDTRRLFIVDDGQDDQEYVDQNGNTCSIEQGDFLRLTQAVLPQEQVASAVVVKATRGVNSCRAGSVIQIDTASLLEMQNSFSETLETGAKEAQSKGINGIPRQ